MRWMLQHDKYLGSKELEFALAAGEYEFAARLSSLGVETNKAFKPLHDNLYFAIVLAQDLDNLHIDWHKLAWDSIDWQEVQGFATPAYREIEDKDLTIQMGKHLKDAVRASDWQAVDGILHNSAEIISIATLLDVLILLTLINPEKIDWFTNHTVVLQRLDTEETQQYQQGTDIFSYLRLHVFDYVIHIADRDGAEILAREQVFVFLSRLLVEHPLLSSFLGDYYDELLQKPRKSWPQQMKGVTRLKQEQHIARLQHILDIFQQQGLDDSSVQYLQLKLQTDTR